MMKWFIATLTLSLAMQVFAADRKIGNMIAVERDIPDLYQTCLDNIRKDDNKEPQKIFSCAIPATHNSAEFVFGETSLIRLYDENCFAEGSVAAGKILIMFNSRKNESSLPEAKSCLQKAVAMKSTYKFIVYTVE